MITYLRYTNLEGICENEEWHLLSIFFEIKNKFFEFEIDFVGEEPFIIKHPANKDRFKDEKSLGKPVLPKQKYLEQECADMHTALVHLFANSLFPRERKKFLKEGNFDSNNFTLPKIISYKTWCKLQDIYEITNDSEYKFNLRYEE